MFCSIDEAIFIVVCRLKMQDWMPCGDYQIDGWKEVKHID
jgi:hypothetical protein